METQKIIISIILVFLIPCSICFTPLDNFLLNCGSESNVSLFNRPFMGDSTKQGSAFLSADKSISLTNQNPPPNLSPLYQTARVFSSTSGYRFNVKKKGTHFVRFHFSPFSAQGFNLKLAKFSILVNGNSILNNFRSNNDTVIKEYILKMESSLLEILFEPVDDSGFGFVNALEVFTAPVDFVVDYGARLVTSDGVEEYRNLSSQILETIHRINVGGMKITPFNDTLWRTWVPDEDYLVFKDAAKRVVSSLKPNYHAEGSSREIAPDNVYMTCQEMNRDNQTATARFNITWNFPVGAGGIRHLVRLHFCDIVSPALNLLYFDVFINGYSAYKDLDLSKPFPALSFPYYVDFVVDSNDSGAIRVSVGPSDPSLSTTMNAILNGAEIMKMVNVMDLHNAHQKNNLGVLVGSLVGGVVVLLLALVGLLHALKCGKKMSNAYKI